MKMSKSSTCISLLLLLAVLAVAQDIAPENYQRQHPWLFPGFLMEGCNDPIYADMCPAFTNVPPGGVYPDYCGYKNNKFTNYTYPCEACIQGQQEAFYFGSCSCAFMNCPADYYCEGGNCIPRPTCATVQCPTGTDCVDGECIVRPPPPPECTVDTDCTDNKHCVDGVCKVLGCN